jgi:hypothetical protein
MIELLRGLQVLFVLAWSVPLMVFVKPAWRKATSPVDQLCAAVWWTGASVIVFPLYWLLFNHAAAEMSPSMLSVWSILYVAGMVAALTLTLATHRVAHDGP